LQQPVSPSRQPEDLQPTGYPPLPPSPSLPAPVGPSPAPQVSVGDVSPLYLHVSVSDTLTASPTSPSLPSLLCSPSSDSSDSTDSVETPASPVWRIKGRRANDAIKCSEGGSLCQEVILEASEPFPEDDLDPFAGPSNPDSVDPVPRSSVRAASSAASPPRRKTLSLFDNTRLTPTVGPPPSPEIPRSASMVNLRRSVTGAFRARVRRYATVPPLDDVPNVPTPTPLNVTIHNGATILAEASQIDDVEVRRLSELAFLG
jgi:hypothetical protein